MQLVEGHVFRATLRRTAIETVIVLITLLLGGLLAWVIAGLPLLYLALPLAATVAAFRLQRVGQAFWEQLRGEALVAALFNLLLTGIWLVSSLLLIRLFALPGSVFFASSALATVALALLPGVTFVGARIGIRLWIFWDYLRRRQFAWALTHALLLTVALVSLILMAIVALQLQRDALPLIGALLLITTAIMVVLLPPFALFSYIFARHATRRIATLAAATSSLRQGEYTTRVVVSGEDEIARLQADFNAMASDLEQTLSELQSERDRVARLMQSQRQLIASVSHELRTPVATIRSYLDATLQPITTTAQPELLRQAAASAPMLPATLSADLTIMQHETARLQALIDDLFTLARAETDSLSFCCIPTNIGQLTRTVVSAVAPLAWQRSRIEIVTDLPADLPDALIDQARWEQVLHNLLHNAIRHTAPGGIIALVGRSDPTQIIVEVRDTGSGIAADDLPHIFERFYRSASLPAADDGAGLGLALVKELLEAMQGSISVSSTIGAGSCFTLHVPAASTEP